MSQQLFYGKIQDFSNPIGNGSNSYIRVRFDATTDSTILTNVTDVTGYLGLANIRVGQQLVESSAFSSGVTITAIDVDNQTITVASLPATAESQGLGRISPAEGDYYIASASLTSPNSTDPDFRNITGSDDSNYTDSPTYAILGQAANSSQQIINGRFHKYTVSEVTGRNAGGDEASIYVKWGESGSQADSGDELYESVQATSLVELSANENLAPIFSRAVTNLNNLNVGQETAAFQIEVVNFFDDLLQTDILQTGSLVSKNNGIINFSGSGVQVDASGSNGVIVRIDGGGGGGSGSSGSSGTSGSSGSSGTSGVDGSSGSSGTSGSSGSSGTSGIDGSSGSSGTSGADGSSGSSGTSGSSGSSGTSGADGSSGSSGTSGSSGSSGTSGADGSSGSSGTSGADGSSGSSGTSGADGSSGSSGTSGSSGSSGTSGADGSSGSSGTSGSSGSSGTSGADGSSGSSGTSGADGSSGSSGTSGSSGSSGTSGADGSSGSSGTSGADGSSGSSGTSGSSGSSGTSGSSGSSGTSGSATITNNTNNSILTATGTDTINGESALTFDGTILTQNSDFERRTSEITVNDGASGNLVSVPTANYLGLVLDYTLLGNDGRARFGTIRAIFDSSSIIIDEVTSTDLNNPTDAITFTASTGTNAVLTVDNGSGSGYNVTVKSFTNLIER